MKKPHYLLAVTLLTLFFSTRIKSQVVNVSGQCISGLITLNPVPDVDGRPAYEDTGTVSGNTGVQVAIYWIAADNVWVLAFDGQPYFETSCNPAEPPATGGSCTWTAVAGQTCTGVDSLVINGSGALPIKVISFTARKNDKEVILNWQTATEINNKGFEIERSGDGTSWTKIGFINGSINSSIEKNYQFTDFNPVAGNNFYRLRQLDIDNKASYSLVVSVNIVKSGFYSISNNPGNGQYRLHIETVPERVDFSIIDPRGRQIMSKNNNGPGDQLIDISNFPPGIYLLRILKGTDLFIERLGKF